MWLLALSLAAARSAGAQGDFGLEGAVGVAIPTGRTAETRHTGLAAHVALRFPRPSSSVLYGVLVDVGYMPGKRIASSSPGAPDEYSALRASTLAATAHLESPNATRGMFAELGAGVSWLTQTRYRHSTTAPMLLGGAGVRAPVRGIPLRFGLQYHLYLTDLVEGADQSVRVSMGIGRR